MRTLFNYSLLMILTILLGCGGGSGSTMSADPNKPPSQTTPPVLLSIEPDPACYGQYLLNYRAGSMGAFGQNGLIYVPEIKVPGGEWYWPNSDDIGVFDKTIRIPLNIYFLPELTEISVRIRTYGVQSPNSASNALPLTLLPSPPQLSMAGFDNQTGFLRWDLVNTSKVNHSFEFEISGTDAIGAPIGWQNLNLQTIYKSPNSLDIEELTAITEMPPKWENLPVLLRVRTVAEGLHSIDSNYSRTTMGLAVPTMFTGTPGPSGITLSWKNNSISPTATILIERTPGLAGLPVSGDVAPIATLPNNVTTYTDQPPLEGTYLYQISNLDGGHLVSGPSVRVTTVNSLTRPTVEVAVKGSRLLLALPNGNFILGDSVQTLVEIQPDGTVVSTLRLPSNAMLGPTRSTGIDYFGNPHVLYQTYNQGYIYRHAWKDADGWQEETLPNHPNIHSAFIDYGMPHLFCQIPGQIWFASAVSPTDNTSAMTVGVMRKVSGEWTAETITAPGNFHPTIYSSDQCVALHPDGTLSVSYTAGTDQVLMQRKPDGSILEVAAPFIQDPGFPLRSMPIRGLAPISDNRLQLFRLGGSSPVLQTFDGTRFSDPEIVPVPAVLTTGSLDSRILPSISASGERLAWILSDSRFSFVGLRSSSGWQFNAISSNDTSSSLLSGFRGVSFWQCHLERDPLRMAYKVVMESEP